MLLHRNRVTYLSMRCTIINNISVVFSATKHKYSVYEKIQRSKVIIVVLLPKVIKLIKLKIYMAIM